jgi:hypothetical protein
MLLEKEKQFILHWQKVRETEGTFRHKLLSGLPMAILFGLPIILLMVVVKIFIPNWYMKAEKKETGIMVPEWTQSFAKVMIAVLFYAYFRKHFKWEMNEQLFKELKYKEKKEAAASAAS